VVSQCGPAWTRQSQSIIDVRMRVNGLVTFDITSSVTADSATVSIRSPAPAASLRR
jgi:hypothetical protein